MVMGFERFEVKDVFTLADLLSILPKEIENKRYGFIYLAMTYDCDFGWMAIYRGIAHYEARYELIDALYSLIIWCLEEKIIKLKDD